MLIKKYIKIYGCIRDRKGNLYLIPESKRLKDKVALIIRNEEKWGSFISPPVVSSLIK